MEFLTSVRRHGTAARLQYLSLRRRIGGAYRRIYHYHVRKTAGTSLNSAFLNAFGLDYASLEQRKLVRKGSLAFVQHNRPLIKRGKFFYASSHAAAHVIAVPAGTFTVTVLRNPVDRLVSHYRYLISVKTDAEAREREKPFMQTLEREMAWLGNSFTDFLERIPREHLLRQLYMFSADYNVEEATQRISACSAVCFTETFDKDLKLLSQRLDLPLHARHERRSAAKSSPTDAELKRARELLDPEFDLLKRVQARLGSAAGHVA